MTEPTDPYDTHTSRPAVTVIGLGPMGRAMTRTLLGHGHPVTVWNRTPSKADDLVAHGAVRATTVHDALAAGELVILSLTDYDAVYATLTPATAALPGHTLVNLSSDTPDRAREAARWAAAHGARHLTGGVQVPPSGIGQPGSSTFYSGPEDAYQAHRNTLATLTDTDYRGADPGLAALYYQMQMDIFWTSMLAYLHALALGDAHGITPEEFLPYASSTMASLPGFAAFYTPRISAGHHPGDVDTLAMGTASVRHILRTTHDAGVNSALPTAVLDHFAHGITAGHARDSFTSLVEHLKHRTP